MEVVLTSNLASSEVEKTTTTCNFQTININSFVMPYDLMRGQKGSYGSTVFTRVSTWGAHLILSSQRGALIQGRCSLEGGAH